MFAAKVMTQSADTQINPGQQTISVNVSADWRFNPNR
jgi:hypothetical protein